MKQPNISQPSQLSGECRFIISGGGTGGHIFPAISIANALKEICPHARILFVGAEGRMEMTRVPDAGYPIVGLPIEGFDRRHPWRNIAVLLKIVRSQLKARKIIKDFKPHVVVGVGGYASGPTLKTAAMMGIPTLIQEQNSYAGVTNKLLARQAKKICVAYPDMERFFPADKIIMTGNPIRQGLLTTIPRADAFARFHLDPNKRSILVMGGSLGARTINQAMQAGIDTIMANGDIQFIWQTGKLYIDQVRQMLKEKTSGEVTDTRVEAIPHLHVTEFIKHMNEAYQIADLVVSRAGASSISEFCILHKPVILVPSPNVAEDHQTKNALALADKGAAIYIKDAEAKEKLVKQALEVIGNEETLLSLSRHVGQLALPHSANTIAQEIIKLVQPS